MQARRRPENGISIMTYGDFQEIGDSLFKGQYDKDHVHIYNIIYIYRDS